MNAGQMQIRHRLAQDLQKINIKAGNHNAIRCGLLQKRGQLLCGPVLAAAMTFDFQIEAEALLPAPDQKVSQKGHRLASKCRVFPHPGISISKIGPERLGHQLVTADGAALPVIMENDQGFIL